MIWGDQVRLSGPGGNGTLLTYQWLDLESLTPTTPEWNVAADQVHFPLSTLYETCVDGIRLSILTISLPLPLLSTA